MNRRAPCAAVWLQLLFELKVSESVHGLRWPPWLHIPVVLDENKPFWPQLWGSHSHSSGVWAHPPCVPWRSALLQAARTFERGASNEKTTHSEGQVHLTKRGNPCSPGSAESCWQMPVIEGKKTLQTSKTSNVSAAGMVDKHHASKVRQVRCANTK